MECMILSNRIFMRTSAICMYVIVRTTHLDCDNAGKTTEERCQLCFNHHRLKYSTTKYVCPRDGLPLLLALTSLFLGYQLVSSTIQYSCVYSSNAI